ncbi:MAG: sortase [Patescibacteria group bacterium]
MKVILAKAAAAWPKIKKFSSSRRVFLIGLVLVIAAAVFVFYPRKTISPTITTAPATDAEEKAEVFEQKKVDIGDFGLDIPSIGVWAPIIPNVDEKNEAAYLKAIESGVALSRELAGNPKENGNMFIFGHSKYYENKPGDYKEVFKDLNKLSAGNKFTVYYRRQSYQYEVLDSKVVAADDFSIRDATPDNPDDKTITIMTCWPPGTIKNRWIIFAKQL